MNELWGEKMSKEEIEKQLNALAEGSQEELLIEKKDYIVFLEVWNSHPEKKSFVGEALLGGNVIYRYKNEEIN